VRYADTEELLRTYDTIVVVGASVHPEKAAHAIPAVMQRYGWRIIPVNPHADEIFGERAYRTLADIPDRPIGPATRRTSLARRSRRVPAPCGYNRASSRPRRTASPTRAVWHMSKIVAWRSNAPATHCACPRAHKPSAENAMLISGLLSR
jgi:CoA binding domain